MYRVQYNYNAAQRAGMVEFSLVRWNFPLDASYRGSKGLNLTTYLIVPRQNTSMPITISCSYLLRYLSKYLVV